MNDCPKPGEPYELYERVELFETGETDEQELALQGGLYRKVFF